jgi:hypothetical protein
MLRPPWKRSVPKRDTLVGQRYRRRCLTTLCAECEALDRRQLLSTAAMAAPELLVPPAASVRAAASFLEDHAPTAFASFRTALARAVQHSNTNQAEVSTLAQDEAVVDQDIESAGLAKGTSADDLRYVEDAVDFALTGSPGIHSGQRFIPLPQVSQWLTSELSNVPAFQQQEPGSTVVSNVTRDVLASASSGSPIEQLVDQVMVVAKNSKPPRAIQAALNHSYNSVSDALGRNAITNLGPGEAKRDALVVYYDGQVNRFLE